MVNLKVFLPLCFYIAFNLIAFSLVEIHAWFQWEYNTYWDDTSAEEAANRKLQWEMVWSKNHTKESVNPNYAPRPRRGHTMVLVQTDKSPKTKQGEWFVVMFGGRDNDGKYKHIPKTYNVEKINGVLTFTTYDDKPVLACQDTKGEYYSPEERANCGTEDTTMIDVGNIFNDVWAYKLCQGSDDPVNYPPKRWFNQPCLDSGWVLWHAGAPEGGCVIQLGIEVCNVPSERYNHAATMFKDGAMYVYGGFSQRCVDFCDDLWFFDIYIRGWRQIYGAGDLQRLYQEIFSFNIIEPYMYPQDEVPKDNARKITTDPKRKLGNAGPGKRWRHTMVGSKVYPETNPPFNCPYTEIQKFALFGGHRLWHGYNIENSEANNWEDTNARMYGGYLNDLWIYTKWLDYKTVPGETFKGNDGRWKKIPPKERCFKTPGVSWQSRFDETCDVLWPTPRAGHASVWDDKRNLIWIFGGYSTYFPYLSTDGPGSGLGVTSIGFGGFVPYPGFDYFKNDLWYFNMSDGYWYEVEYPPEIPVPRPRVEMVMLLTHDVLFMHGGFADNNYFDDLWYFNITTMKWLEKKRFVYPQYPESCTDDIEYIQTHNCTHLLWPKHLERYSDFPFKIKSPMDQPSYWPDPINGPYWPIQQKGFSHNLSGIASLISADGVKPINTAPYGTPVFPYAASGPLQYVESHTFTYNTTHIGTYYESCVSVFAEPTRGKSVDGLYGRRNGSLFIPQPRNKRPGWDGCRDRADKRVDLPLELMYVKPLPRANHKAIFYEEKNEIIMYGGIGYSQQERYTVDDSFATTIKDEMWYFNLYHCINNCSNRGVCKYGFCFCDVGYYGEDCSNISCPGTSCYYDENSNDQVCVHACSAGYWHQNVDNYVQDRNKLPCTRERPGEINGVCDGFGKSYCAPPFIGDDCSIRDCKDNCSFNGWCSVEYPVSRCMCLPGYFGDICEHKLCLNNCSYPNGVCNITSGECNCRKTFSPFNSTREFKKWDGEDCSYIFPYAAAPRRFSRAFDNFNVHSIDFKSVSSFMLPFVLMAVLFLNI